MPGRSKHSRPFPSLAKLQAGNPEKLAETAEKLALMSAETAALFTTSLIRTRMGSTKSAFRHSWWHWVPTL